MKDNDQVIREAKFFSSDKKNRPFTLTATSAHKKNQKICIILCFLQVI